MQTIDVTPRWQDIIEIHIQALEASGSESARKEIRRLAKIADQYNELVKSHNALITAIQNTDGIDYIEGELMVEGDDEPVFVPERWGFKHGGVMRYYLSQEIAQAAADRYGCQLTTFYIRRP